MVASDSFAEFLREQLAPLGRVTTRRMFGKTGVFHSGLMFGMVANDTLFFRVDDHNRAIFKEAESAPPLSYEKQGRDIDLSFLARAGAITRRTRGACHVGAGGAGGGTPGCSEEATDSAKSEVKVASHSTPVTGGPMRPDRPAFKLAY
jgi:TfoX/Sxy family transcriptional regulator of competence genes